LAGLMLALVALTTPLGLGGDAHAGFGGFDAGFGGVNRLIPS
jgi:hypothetical protein